MDRETLKAWVHYALLNPIDEHQLAHAQATKELLEENARYREALEFYANQSNWSYTTIQDSKWYETLEDDATEINGNHYSGRRAREALKGNEK